ncbi:MAG: DUF2203 domain-containing protein [Gemmatimonadetes bacterium]|nr:DUF2203 domain-containing protein [Gemmatimonadota bacterium]
MSARRRAPVLKVELPYTPAAANRALPLVRHIVGDLVQQVDRWEAAVRQVELASHDNVLENAESERWQREAQRLAAAIEGCVHELMELGVEVRALNTGLVDFPGTLDGREVYFCWMLGEAAVTHYHERDAGFTGRQPLPVEALTPLG